MNYVLCGLSADDLNKRRASALRVYLSYREMMKVAYMEFLEVDAEIERRKVLNADDRKKQMAEAISKSLFEPTLSKREDK